jgi:catechol 2,3-dioxygenase-like lactoylglutathione lyase family enzyme
MLQNAPMYSYIPAKDVARARKFYEETLGFKPKHVTAGGVVYEFGKGTAGASVINCWWGRSKDFGKNRL